MENQNIMQNISSILEKVLGSGIALNGQIGINGLTISTVDKAKSIGLLPQQAQQGSQPQGQDDQKQQQNGKSQDSFKDQEKQQSQQGGQEQGQVSREEMQSMMEEIRYLKKLMESSQQNDGGQKGKPQSK